MPSWTKHGPLSIQGGQHAVAHEQDEEAPAVQLKVVDRDDEQPGRQQACAAVSSQAAAALGFGGAGRALLQLASGSDCVVSAIVSETVPDGAIALSQVQQFNLKVASGCIASFSLFRPPEGQPFELVDLELEVGALGGRAAEAASLQVDARQLTRRFLGRHFGSVVAVNEACVLRCTGESGEDSGDGSSQDLLLRVVAANTLDAEAREEAVGYHCYRGLVGPGTAVYLTPSCSVAAPAGGAGGGAQSLAASRAAVQLVGARARPPAGLRSGICITTSDGEMFPVSRRLLRGCIALTRHLRSEEGSAEVSVDIDTLTFDRVLIFLEAEALGREPPAFGLHLIAALQDAADKLGLRSLQGYCAARLGAAESRLRRYSFDEVRRLNAAGGCWLILDGMVLDVTRWLPEHPGGAKIIPAQSLNMDCSRFFELYHASRESFVYLKEFYCGEVLAADRAEVPAPKVQPSAEFLAQLREYTAWRMPDEQPAHRNL